MLHVIPSGKLVEAGQASATVPVYPKLGVTVMVVDPGWPAVRLRLFGDAARVKSAWPIVIVIGEPELLPE